MNTHKNSESEHIDVSIIIPAYNAEKYIYECIHSLVDQSLCSIEILIVDDGSTDHTREIIESQKEIDSRIILIQQSKQGAGAARNTGLSRAKGKYVLFLDADDFFDKNLVRDTYIIAEKNEAQIVLFDYFSYNELNGEITRIHTPNCPRGQFSSKDLGNRIYQICKTFSWNKLYLKSFIVENGLKFQNIKRSNDVYFSICSVSMAQRMVHLNKGLVYYRTGNPKSLQGNINDNVECSVLSRMEVKRELIKRGLFENGIKESFYHSCKDLRGYVMRTTNSESLKIYYGILKEHLVPDLFESEELFSDEKILSAAYKSDKYEEFVFELYRMTRRDYIPKERIDYRLGRLLLVLPRRAKSIVNRLL